MKTFNETEILIIHWPSTLKKIKNNVCWHGWRKKIQLINNHNDIAGENKIYNKIKQKED